MSEYRTGQIVFSQGDAADSVFYIVRGKIKIAVTSEQRKEAVVGLLSKGGFFGEGCLIGQPMRLATAASMTDATVMRIEKAEMVRVLQIEPAFAEVFTAHLLTRNSRVEADLVDHRFNSSEKRLARTLLLLANFGKEGRPEPISTKISQETLAEMIGTTRPRVSFFTRPRSGGTRLVGCHHSGRIEPGGDGLFNLVRSLPDTLRYEHDDPLKRL
jgi:CRP/FNR family cyclic AMP-dependent transcriptional regulator